MNREWIINSTQVESSFRTCHFNIWFCITRPFPNPPDSPYIFYFADTDKNNLWKRKLL